MSDHAVKIRHPGPYRPTNAGSVPVKGKKANRLPGLFQYRNPDIISDGGDGIGEFDPKIWAVEFRVSFLNPSPVAL